MPCILTPAVLLHSAQHITGQVWHPMQENPNAIPEGETPHSVTLFAHDHLVDMAKPGDRIMLTGIYKVEGMRVNPRIRMLKSVYKTFIDAIHISKDERSKNFSAKMDDSLGDGTTQEGASLQESEEPAFQVPCLGFAGLHREPVHTPSVEAESI